MWPPEFTTVGPSWDWSLLTTIVEGASEHLGSTEDRPALKCSEGASWSVKRAFRGHHWPCVFPPVAQSHTWAHGLFSQTHGLVFLA